LNQKLFRDTKNLNILETN